MAAPRRRGYHRPRMQRSSRHPTLSRAALWPAAVVLLGAVLRFMQMGLIRYGYDQSYPAFQAVGLLDGGAWPLIGQPSSVFLDNPALMPYLQRAVEEYVDIGRRYAQVIAAEATLTD